MRIFQTLLMILLITSVGIASSALAQTLEEADALLAESRWSEAATAYQAVVADSPDDSAAWFGLGQANRQLAEYEAAEVAYLKAQENGFQPLLRFHYQLARVYMLMGETDKALEQIEAIGNTGGISNQVLLAVAEFESLNDNPRYMVVIEKLAPCKSEHYRHFDFWLGQWDVAAVGSPGATAQSSITSVQGGCAVLEEYQTQSGFSGMSINFYDSTTEMWHQSWMGNGGGAVHLQGKLIDGAMVLSDADLKVSELAGTINRVTWSLQDDGQVRQHWENSADKGETWTTSFDGYYKARAAE